MLISINKITCRAIGHTDSPLCYTDGNVILIEMDLYQESGHAEQPIVG